MSVNRKVLLIEKQKLEKDFNAVNEQLKSTEAQVQSLRNNLNAIHGAIQQTDKLLSMVEEEKEDDKVVQKS
tara:strand:+ start:2076 stop:2288 length:213 start_codon:yes stop_codon:yes gene_type:complete